MSLKCHPIRRPGHWCPPSLVQRIVSRFRGNGQTRISASSQPSSSALSCGLNRSDLDRQQNFGFAHRPHRGAGSPGSQLRAGAPHNAKAHRHLIRGAKPSSAPRRRPARRAKHSRSEMYTEARTRRLEGPADRSCFLESHCLKSHSKGCTKETRPPTRPELLEVRNRSPPAVPTASKRPTPCESRTPCDVA
jgi:hypothetical protein